MLNLEKTLEKYKVDASTLSPSSNQLVVFTCPRCQKDEDYGYAYATRKIMKAKERGVECVCQKCSHSHRVGQAPSITEAKAYYPPEMDAVQTLKKFGYTLDSVSPWSRNRIAVKCSVSGKFFYPRRCSLNRYKSVMETGHYISKGVIVARRRLGQLATAETKAKMKASQGLRRTREKQAS